MDRLRSSCDCTVVLVLNNKSRGVVDAHQLEVDGAAVHAYEDDRVGLQVGHGSAHGFKLDISAN